MKLRKFQIEAKDKIDKQVKSLVISAPTGAGKTLVATFAAEKGRTIIIGPLRALSSEQYKNFTKNFKTVLDTGDAKVSVRKYLKPWDVIITTYERYDSFLRSPKRRKILEQVQYLVVDEVHQISSSRGYRLESAILKTRELLPHVKVICLSATISNPEEVAKWLGGECIISKKRPVPLEIDIRSYVRKGTAEFDDKIRVLKKLFSEFPNDQFLVFCSSRSKTARLSKIFKLSGHHHAGLSSDTRAAVEQAFLSGKIKVLFSTTTLAYGINLPAKHVVVFDVKRFNQLVSNKEFLPVDELYQLIGRAGRPQFDKEGFAHIICSKKDINTVKKTLTSKFEVHSQITPRVLPELVLEWVVSEFIFTEEDMYAVKDKLFCSTITTKDLEDALLYLISNDFVRVSKSGYFNPTHKGNLTALLYVSPETVSTCFEPAYEKYRASPLKSVFWLFSYFLQSNEFMEALAIRPGDLQVIDAARKFLPPQTDERVLKAFSIIFNSSFALSEDKLKVKEQAARHLRAAAAILNDRKLSSSLSRLQLLVKYETLDETRADLLKVPGVGKVYAEKLIKAKVLSVRDLLSADLKKVLGVGEKTERKIKEGGRKFMK